jgi:hypothetical protein
MTEIVNPAIETARHIGAMLLDYLVNPLAELIE